MTNENAETPRGLGGAFHEDHTAGGSMAMLAQLARRREAALRCEPLDCGHRDPEDCDDACGVELDDEPCNEIRNEIPEAPKPPPAAGQWWVNAKARFLAREFPTYGTQAWKDLAPEDPKRLAATLDYAEMWRKYGADITSDLDQASRMPDISGGRSRAELDQAWRDILARNERDWADRRAAIAARPKQWATSAGWPPVAIPGRPGWWRHCIDGQQVDLPHNRKPETEERSAA